MLAGRALQGVGGALFPLSFSVIRDEFPAESLATGLGLMSAIAGSAVASGSSWPAR